MEISDVDIYLMQNKHKTSTTAIDFRKCVCACVRARFHFSYFKCGYNAKKVTHDFLLYISSKSLHLNTVFIFIKQKKISKGALFPNYTLLKCAERVFMLLWWHCIFSNEL